MSSNSTSGNQSYSFSSDPYLQFQPNFALSLPIQLLITGIVLTLGSTLLIQLLFTWQYHWPLARVNWTFQFTAVCALLFNVIAILYVVLSALAEKSKQWPYMFEYIAIEVPRTGWTIAQIAVWFLMEAITSALATATHIQFLTYLYPSPLEARLVCFLLGPLAVVASIMTLLPITTFQSSSMTNSTLTVLNLTVSNDSVSHDIVSTTAFSLSTNISDSSRQLTDIFDAARNICNLTLSFLFTLSLLIWGFLVNRSSAWRTDGGTAAFGAGALLLALVSTALNFLNVFSHPPYEWLTPLLWSVVLWQSFLGWWWWVGSASGIAARELDQEKRGRKEQKRAKRKRRKISENCDENSVVGTVGRLERWRSSVGATLSRRRPPTHDSTLSQTSTFQGEAIELSPVTSITSDRPQDHVSPSTSSLAPSHESRHSATHFFTAAWRTLRQAHIRAMRVQAIEQRQIQIQMELENGRGLGRFPGGTGGERSTLRGNNIPGGVTQESRVGRNRDGETLHESKMGGSQWWWVPLKKWRLRDSTIY